MKYRGLMIFLLGVIFLLPPVIYAHGVMGKIDAGGVVVSAEYDTGEPMSYAKVKISAPGARLTFQSGRTDRNGRFCFFPDGPGDWKVVVDDEMGHRLEVMVPVNEALVFQANQERGEASETSLSRCQKALMGISIIFGISGILFWWRGRKSREAS
jgi:nickel transport protein